MRGTGEFNKNHLTALPASRPGGIIRAERYEWMLACQADELHRIADLMRDLRGPGARWHVREEVPFATGRRRSFSEILVTMP